MVNPENNEIFTSTNEEKFNSVDDINFDFFEFEKPWEIKEGTWVFQIIEDDSLLLSKEFKIQKIV